MSRSSLVLAFVTVVLVFCLAYPAISQDKATPSEIVSQVRSAAATLAKTGDPGLTEFNKKPSPWVWKDTYIFVLDCSKNVMAAHPMKPELVGKDILSMKDTQGKAFFEELCGVSKTASGLWVEYFWPKPGDTAGSRKISYALKAAATPYVVAAGVYDDKISIGELGQIK